MKEKIQFQSKQIVSLDEDSKEILDIARKRGIKVPSVHLGFFKSIYAKIESSNLNGIRLGKEAVEKALPGLIGSQVNFEHMGIIMGNNIDAWVNANDEIVVVFTMFKSVFPDEYERSIELAKEGKLSISFELLSEKESQDNLEDGTIRLNDIDFIGTGFLMDNPPAEPSAKISEFAKRTKERLSYIDDRELVCASVIEKACDEILADEHNIDEDELKMPELFIVTTSDDNHFHVADMDFDGNGITISGHGEGKHPEPHDIVNWQIQVAKNADPETGEHSHRILNEIMATIKEYVKVRADKWTSDIYNKFPDSSFAVIEPAYLNGETGDRKARHLAFLYRDGRFDLTNYRIALHKVDEILPITNSITTEELRKQAKEKLDEFSDVYMKAEEHLVIFPAGSSKVKDDKDHFPINTIGQARNALARVAQFDSVPSWYDGTLSELVQKVKNAVKRQYPSIEVSLKTQGGVKFMTQEEIQKIKALRDELGDLAKDVTDEDLLDDAKVAELRETAKKATDVESKSDTKADEKKDEKKDKASEGDKGDVDSDKDDSEKAQERIKELEGKVEELENTLEAKNSEIEAVRENAEKIGKAKVELKDNEFTKDFKDEDYLNEEKVSQAIQDQKDSETVATRKEELKDNEYAKDFKDEDYLNDDKVELVKVKKEKDDIVADKEAINASENDEEADPDLEIGDKNNDKGETSYQKVIASIRQNANQQSSKQKVITRQK